MNKKLILIIFFVSKIVYSQVDELASAESVIDFNKVNGSQELDKLSFTNIETSMKLMEDNILKLMRELGELKMQVHELKANVKKEVENQQKLVEQYKRELDLKSKQNQSENLAQETIVQEPLAEIKPGMDLSSTETDEPLEVMQDIAVTVTKSN